MINYLLMGCILFFRPLLGPATCRFHIGCTEFALNMLKTKPLYKAIPLITERVLTCNPFTR